MDAGLPAPDDYRPTSTGSAWPLGHLHRGALIGQGVTAYSNLTYLGHHPDDGDQEHPRSFCPLHVKAFAYGDYPHALNGVPNLRSGRPHAGKEVLIGGCFAITEQTDTHAFSALKSYAEHNQWRADLARRYNGRGPGEGTERAGDFSAPEPGGPFYELLWFADNEGTLCQLAATSLLDDFRRFEKEYAAEHDDNAVRVYRHWMRACELAADGGLIDLH